MDHTENREPARQKLIVIEGLDGSGKATQAKLLAENLEKEGMKVREISFPDYQSPSSSLVKMYLSGAFGTHPDDVNAYAASSFYAVDRYASYKKDWKDDYQSGVVIADRYTTSNAIHQCSKLDQSEWDGYLDWLSDYEYKLLGIPAPDLVIYLRVDPEVSQKLLAKRYKGDMSKEDIHEKNKNYLKRCQEAAAYCSTRLDWKTGECTEAGRMRSIEQISFEIINLVQKNLRQT